ncbi:MAG TPA: hypothetical protein VGG35_04080 [Streptosporangiaceae bacterium]
MPGGEVTGGDMICTSVVGAGPERGAYVLPVLIAALPEPAPILAAAAART